MTPANAAGQGVPRWQTLWVTRPAAEAAHWVSALQAAGWPARALPLIDISEPDEATARAALTRHRSHWWQNDALMFVSAAAVQHFFAHDVLPAPAAHSLTTRFWAPGPGTARALALALAGLGVSADRIDAPPADSAQFDSEHLWPVVATQLHRGARVLIVRGHSPERHASRDDGLSGTGRDWLIQRCEAAGARVDACVAYERRAPVWSAHEQGLVRSASGADQLWLFSSSEALTNLEALAPGMCWSAAALATHPRIAAAARSAGFDPVIESRPALPDVLRALKSIEKHP